MEAERSRPELNAWESAWLARISNLYQLNAARLQSHSVAGGRQVPEGNFVVGYGRRQGSAGEHDQPPDDAAQNERPPRRPGAVAREGSRVAGQAARG